MIVYPCIVPINQRLLTILLTEHVTCTNPQCLAFSPSSEKKSEASACWSADPLSRLPRPILARPSVHMTTFDPGTFDAIVIATSIAGPRAVCPPSSRL